MEWEEFQGLTRTEIKQLAKEIERKLASNVELSLEDHYLIKHMERYLANMKEEQINSLNRFFNLDSYEK